MNVLLEKNLITPNILLKFTVDDDIEHFIHYGQGKE